MPSKNSSATKQKNDRPKLKFSKSKFILLFLLTALLLLGGGTLAAQIPPSVFFRVSKTVSV
jgi:cell division septal protein FtsQ